MSDNTKHHFKSRYIVDVILENDYIQLVDSSHAEFYIDKSNKQLISQFSSWFKNIFLKGTNQFLLVFECHNVDHDGQCDVIIDRLMNIDNTEV